MSASASHKRILVVDDDPAYVEMLRLLLDQFRRDAWEVHTAGEAGQALAILREKDMNLMLVDARMPVVDGLQLIRIARQHHPTLRIAALTGFADESARATYLANGADAFFEKPRSSEGIQTLLAALDSLLLVAPRQGFRSVLDHLELQDLLQIECSKRNSSVLEVTARSERGRIFIKDGELIHAETGSLEGEPALFSLLSLQGGELRFRPYEPPSVVSIAGTWMSLLMEWAQRRDEFVAPPQELDPGLPPGIARSAAPPREDLALSALLSSPLTDAERAPLREHIQEMLLCGGAGDVLYEKGCDRFVARRQFLDAVARRADMLGALLPLGRFELLEFETAGIRGVVQASAEVSLLVLARPESARGPDPGP